MATVSNRGKGTDPDSAQNRKYLKTKKEKLGHLPDDMDEMWHGTCPCTRIEEDAAPGRGRSGGKGLLRYENPCRRDRQGECLEHQRPGSPGGNGPHGDNALAARAFPDPPPQLQSPAVA